MCVDPIVAFYSYRDKKFIEFKKLALLDKPDLIDNLKKSGKKIIASGYWQIIPCRKCIGCLIDRSIEWRNRLIKESEYYKNNMCFITLTYRDDKLHFNNQNIPVLFKSDVQNFFKRLRKYFSDKEFRYFLCGEYGSKTKRPHYHCIIFGLNLNDFKDIELDFEENGFQYFHSYILEHKIWKLGKCVIANVDDKCIGYCASYCVKKINKEIKYKDLGIIEPFILTSKGKGGLGSKFLLDNSEIIKQSHFKYLVHYDGRTCEASIPYSQMHYITGDKSKDYKSISKYILYSSKDYSYDANSLSAYIYDLEHNPFFHSSKYFNSRIDILKNKINLKEVL